MDCYDALANVYDRFMDDFDYEAWTDYYLKLIRRAGGEAVQTICDCGCGTGNFSIELARRGFRVTGVDLSAAMLEEAARKTRAAGERVMYVRQDMCRLELSRRVDAILCGCDGVNYLTTDRMLEAFIARARAALKAGGVLAFDVSSVYKLKSVLADGFFGEDRGDAAYLWKSEWDDEARIQTMRITFFVREAGGLYRRFQEEHRQRAWTVGELTAALRAGGFGEPIFCGDRRLEAPATDEMRIHVAAQAV